MKGGWADHQVLPDRVHRLSLVQEVELHADLPSQLIHGGHQVELQLGALQSWAQGSGRGMAIHRNAPTWLG